MTQPIPPSLDAPTADWLVYADALQEARDPRGELIVLNEAASGGASVTERDAFVNQNAEALLGGAGARIDAYRLKWRFCFVESAEVVVRTGDDAKQLVADLLASPAAAHVREIALVGVQPIDLTGAMELLAAKLPASCRSVAFIDERASKTTRLVSRDFDPDANLVTLGSLEPFWNLPQLERVHASVADGQAIELGTVNAPNLRSFVFHSLRYAGSYGDPSPVTAPLAGAVWPKLESFELRLPETWVANVPDDADAYVPVYSGNDEWEDRMDEAEDGENEGVNWQELDPLLRQLAKSPLKRLALTSFDSADSLLGMLAAAGLPATLEELDLSDSSVASADWFLANKALLAPLKRLVLERTSLSDDDAKKLAGLGPEIVHSSGGGARYRFVVGCE
ncbi:MAG: hypothetical protein K0S65_4091 [Labilithrix sp.]|nr:hypothetical protein [Labilithrix sp.]